MKTFWQKINSKDNLVYQHTKDFFYGYSFPVLVAFLVFLSYAFNLSLIGMGIIVLVVCFLFFFYEELTPFFPLMLTWLFSFSDKSIFSEKIWILLIIVSPVLPLLIIRLIKFNRKFKPGMLLASLLAVCIALFSGGLFSWDLNNYASGLSCILTVGPLLVVVYCFFRNYVHPTKEVNLKVYFSYVLTIAGCLVSAELFLHVVPKSNVLHHTLGWGQTNAGATFIATTIFFSLYLACKTNHGVLALFGYLFQFAGIVASKSDAVFAIVTIFTPIAFFLCLFLSKKEIRLRLISLLLLFLFLFSLFVIVGTATGFLQPIVERFSQNLTSDSGRLKIYQKAWDLFKRNPAFGVGLGGFYDHSTLGYTPGFIKIYYFHSTLMQVIACMGIVGIFAYAYYFYSRYKIIMLKRNLFTTIAFIAFTVFSIYGMIDCCEFYATPTMLTATQLIAFVEIINVEKGKADALPLSLFKS